MTIKNTLSLLNVIPANSSAELSKQLTKEGVMVFKLQGKKISSKASFLEAACRDLPQPLSTLPAQNYAALSDNLWQGLSGLGKKDIVIIWEDAEVMMDTDLQAFLEAVDLFSSLGRQFADHAAGIQFYLVLSGKGRGWSRL